MPELTASQWLLAVLAAAGIGVAKSGFSGVSMLHVIVFAGIFGARDSTGVVLPMLIVGDILAVLAFRQHARWDYIRRLLPPAAAGVIAGALLVRQGESIAELTAWIATGSKIATISQTVHAYPTFSEGPSRAADDLLRAKYFSPRMRRVTGPAIGVFRFIDRLRHRGR